MNKVENVYKGGFFKNRHRLSWRAPIVGKAICDTFDLECGDRIVDVGCAIGDYVKWLNEAGMNAYGIEGSPAAQEFFVTDQIKVWDLRIPLNLGPNDKKYHIAFSLEVAEHIEPDFADIYVSNLCALSDTILISAASPGQKGHGHVNCVPASYWIRKFNNAGFKHMRGYGNLWQSLLAPFRTRKELSSYIKNVLVFRRMAYNGKL